MKNNATNSILPYPSAHQLTGAKYVAGALAAVVVPVGTTDLYTCPSGKRAMVSEVMTFNTNAVGSVTYAPQVKIGGVYYNVRNATSSVAPQVQNFFAIDFILEAGESIAIVASATGMSVRYKILEFDANVPIYTPRLTSLVTGNNVLYTVSAGRSALLMSLTLETVGYLGAYYASNQSGANRNYGAFLVPNGQVPAATHKAAANATVGTGTAGPVRNLVGSMASGDSLVISVDNGSGQQLVWTNVMEV